MFLNPTLNLPPVDQLWRKILQHQSDSQQVQDGLDRREEIAEKIQDARCALYLTAEGMNYAGPLPHAQIVEMLRQEAIDAVDDWLEVDVLRKQVALMAPTPSDAM